MHHISRRTVSGGPGVPIGLLELLLGVSPVRPGVVDTARRRLALAPLPTSGALAASVVDVLLAGRCS